MEAPAAVVVIGAGFSGAITAAQLLRRASGDRLPLLVTLINRSGRMARGVAYGTRSAVHVLNVPAGRMSAFADDEDSFLRFAREYDPAVTSGSFVPRRLYGEYLEDVLAAAAVRASPHATLQQIVGEVGEVDVAGERPCVVLTDGRRIEADRVVVAAGNYAPADPPLGDASFYERSCYVRDPWERGALDGIAASEDVLLLGTGLTMMDVALWLRARGNLGQLHALSRRGLLPQPHRSPSVSPTSDHRPPGMESCAPTARAYLRAVRRHVQALALRGIDWRDVIGSLRSITPALWRRLENPERARFLRHVRPYWEVHRHRAAPEPFTALRQLMEAGALRVCAGRLLTARARDERVEVSWCPRGATAAETLLVDRVVNCTGPDGDPRRLRDPLMVGLLERGLVRPDPLGQGLEVADDGAVLDAGGQPSPFVYLVGPLLRARDWEATAVPELRVRADELARTLLASIARSRSGGGPQP